MNTDSFQAGFRVLSHQLRSTLLTIKLTTLDNSQEEQASLDKVLVSRPRHRHKLTLLNSQDAQTSDNNPRIRMLLDRSPQHRMHLRITKHNQIWHLD